MATTHKQLNTVGQLATSNASALYTVPAATKGMVKTIILHNTDSSDAKTAEIFYNGTANSTRILNVSLDAGETFEYSVGHMLPLAATETIHGREAATGSVVNCFIFGAEE
jgi:hypothetical protein